jgi:hypothetical protein
LTTPVLNSSRKLWPPVSLQEELADDLLCIQTLILLRKKKKKKKEERNRRSRCSKYYEFLFATLAQIAVLKPWRQASKQAGRQAGRLGIAVQL